MPEASTLYRTPAGEAKAMAVYDAGMEHLGIPLASRTVSTRYGQTHVLVTGPEDAPPVMILQGGNFFSPLSLAWFKPLVERYRIYAPDSVGHPGRSAASRLSPDDDSYGQWVVDVMDALGIDRAAFIAPSFGAGITLRTAAIAPDRISLAILLVPAGIVRPRVIPLIAKLALPMLLYRLAPSRKRLMRAIQPLFTEEIPELWLEATKAVFDHVKIEAKMPRPVRSQELAAFKAPTLVIAAERDPLFPGKAVLQRAKRVIPSLRGAELLAGSRHVPAEATLQELNAWIQAFLDAHAPETASHTTHD